MTMIELDHVTKLYDQKPVLKDVSIQFDKGSFTYIIGQSGSGKSTLLKLLYREERFQKGFVRVLDYKLNKLTRKHVQDLRREIGVVFQDHRLLEDKTVYENIAFPLYAIDKPSRMIHKRVKELLRLIGLPHKANAYPAELSGGEQQRVGIARAIANNPKILLADEPTGNLDPETSVQIMKLFEDIHLQGTTVVMATHDQALVNQFRHRVIVLDNGQIARDEKGGYHEKSFA